MRPNPLFPADLSHLLKKSLMENFIFCAVSEAKSVGANPNNVLSLALESNLSKRFPVTYGSNEMHSD